MNKDVLLGHYDVLSAFNEEYYKDLITKNNLGEETIIKVNEEQKFVYPVKYKGKIYAIPSKVVEDGKLPIKIQKAIKVGYRTSVYHYVTEYASARIKDQKTMTYRQLINNLAKFEHSEPDDFLLYKIVATTLYLRKGFVRIVSPAAFGKNSIVGILKTLMTDVAIANPKSTAALEHKLINKMVVLDEMTNLEKTHRSSMQDALLMIADGSPSYEKSTRGSAKIGTKDEYDISKLSVQIQYNIYQYYIDAGQGDKYFDNVFQYALKSRFLPLYFDGVLDSQQFVNISKPKAIAGELTEDIKKFIRALKYYQANFEKEDNDFKLFKEYKISREGRHEKTFHVICQGIRLYAKDEIEYNKLVERLYACNLKYVNMMNKSDVTEVPLDVEYKGKVKQDSLGSYM